jgi:hypothetical protein
MAMMLLGTTKQALVRSFAMLVATPVPLLLGLGPRPQLGSLGRSVDCEKNRADEGEHIKKGGGGEVVNRMWRRYGEGKKEKN